MKRLYFWNDLNIFFKDEKELAKAEEKFKRFFESISKNNKTIFYYISYHDTQAWMENISSFRESANIYLGTRPSKLFDRKNQSSLTIYPKRVRDARGKTKEVFISEKDKELIKNYLKNVDVIRIIEDVMVCGVTIDKLIEEIGEENLSFKLVIEFFLENTLSSNEIKAKYGGNIVTDRYMEMQGISITESTCICAYDLLEGKINDMDYDESFEKLRYFFGDYTSRFLDLMGEIRESLNGIKG